MVLSKIMIMRETAAEFINEKFIATFTKSLEKGGDTGL